MIKDLYNLNIERGILAGILLDPSQFDEIHALCKADYFYLPFHKLVFSAMESLNLDEAPIDEDFIRKKIDDKDFDENAFLEILSTSALTNLDKQADELADLHTKRELVALTTKIKKLTEDKNLLAIDAIDEIQQFLYKIVTDNTIKNFKSAKDVSEEVLLLIKRNKELSRTKGVIGVPSGFRKFDEITRGFNNGDMIIVAARPSMGKTALVLNIADAVLRSGKGVAFFSLEMPASHLLLRMLSSRTSAPLQSLLIGDLSEEQWQDLNNAIEDYSNSQLFIDDDSALNISKLRSKLRDLKAKHPEVSVAIIDYIQLMSGNASKDRHLEVSEISRGIKMLARELDMPIIALSQLNRSLETRPDKRPMLADIRESGSIEQDADIIMFLYRDDVYKEREERQKEKQAKELGKEYKSTFKARPEEDAELIIAKHRNGPLATIDLVFHKKFTRFVDKSGDVIETTYQDTNIPVTISQNPTPPPDDDYDMPI
ncbi:MAG: replicative DNA helicase [Helicobacteraceae bacterium]